MLEEYIQELERVYASKSEGYPLAFEDVLEKIVQLNDANSIPQLMPLFEDEAEYDELMFSVLHSIEVFEDSIYVSHLLEGFDALRKASPRWASIILMRVLNSTPTLDVLKGLLPSASKLQNDAILTVAKDIAGRRSEFKTRVDDIHAIADHLPESKLRDKDGLQ